MIPAKLKPLLRAAPEVDVIRQSKLWTKQRDAEATVREAIAAAVQFCDAVPPEAEVCVVLADDRHVQDLNLQWRGQDKPTNVLSFPAPRREGDEDEGATVMLGDIVIAYETLAREAEFEKRPFRNHLAHLTVHGFLHLLGYEHDTEDEAEDMERLEARILENLGIPDPYAARPRAITR
jgi:probable rRNA maturation factor